MRKTWLERESSPSAKSREPLEALATLTGGKAARGDVYRVVNAGLLQPRAVLDLKIVNWAAAAGVVGFAKES